VAEDWPTPITAAHSGWRTKRAEIRAVYGFLAPTGRFKAGANNNVGSGIGQTACLRAKHST